MLNKMRTSVLSGTADGEETPGDFLKNEKRFFCGSDEVAFDKPELFFILSIFEIQINT